MKYHLCLILLILLAKNSFASDKTADEIVKQYDAGDMSEITSHANGIIDGVEHAAIISEQISPTYGGPLIIVYQKKQDKLEIVTKIDLQGDYARSYNLSIEKNSIYIENLIGHHGWHGTRYQFKKFENRFKLIGAESRSEALGCYSGDESAKCDEYESWSGTSYNLLNSSAICWRDTFYFRDKRFNEKTQNQEDWNLPKAAKRHLIKLKTAKQPLLDEFDFYDYSLPNACYFDYKNKLHIEPASSGS